MAHERIIQLEKDPNYLTDHSYPDCSEEWFLSSVADYVSEDEYHDETIEGFTEFLQSFSPYVDVFSEKIDEDEEVLCVVFREGFKQAYFSSLYPLFEKALHELVENTSLEAFCGYKLDMLLYSLNKIYDNRFGTYISSEENGLITINDFVRNIEPNVKYYIGGTADYHH